MKNFVLCAFILTYIFIICFSKYKTIITGISALIISLACLIFGEMSFNEIISSIDYNVVLMLIGIMLTVGFFSASKMPNLLANKLISKIPNTVVSIILLSVLSGFISAFIDNVATVLMLAPIGLEVAKRTDVSPIPIIISISVSSNLQGAATLVGDTTSIMLGGSAKMSFFDFFFLEGKPSIFFAVELGAILTIPVLYFIFRKNKKTIKLENLSVKLTSVVPTIFLLLNILSLVVASFINLKFDYINGCICMFFGFVSLIFYLIKFRGETKKLVKESLDIQTVLFLMFIFIIIGAVEKVGIISDIASLFTIVGSKNVLLLFTLIVFGSVFFSAFIDNIPYVATLLPVIDALLVDLPNVSPYLLYFGLLIGATLGGNITPVGASANVVGIGILNKNGFKVKNSDFFKIGIPFTLVAVLSGYLFCYLVWY